MLAVPNRCGFVLISYSHASSSSCAHILYPVRFAGLSAGAGLFSLWLQCTVRGDAPQRYSALEGETPRALALYLSLSVVLYHQQEVNDMAPRQAPSRMLSTGGRPATIRSLLAKVGHRSQPPTAPSLAACRLAVRSPPLRRPLVPPILLFNDGPCVEISLLGFGYGHHHHRSTYLTPRRPVSRCRRAARTWPAAGVVCAAAATGRPSRAA